MDKRLDFRFEVPKAPSGPVIELNLSEAEELLLQKLADSREDRKNVLWQLAHLYKNSKQHDKALARLRERIALLPEVESKAQCVFTMGQAMEQIADYPAAVRYYKEALSLEPTNNFTWYFINNNLGFSLNTLGNFSEGEGYCRKAIQIDPNRPNGHKNLGIALAGQSRFAEAARAFVEATQANAADPRALRLLEDLLREHPELEYEFREDADFCRKANEVAEAKINECQPVIHRGWRKQLFLLTVRLKSFFSRLKSGDAKRG